MITNAMLHMRVSKTILYKLATIKKVKIFYTLDGIYITYKNKEYEFIGSNKNKKAFDFLNKLKVNERRNICNVKY